MMAGTGRSVVLPAAVDLDALDPLRDRLLAALEQGAVTVDASGVERLATNGLLLLLSAAETARRQAAGFAIVGASAPFLAAIDRLGLAPQFSSLMKG